MPSIARGSPDASVWRTKTSVIPRRAAVIVLLPSDGLSLRAVIAHLPEVIACLLAVILHLPEVILVLLALIASLPGVTSSLPALMALLPVVQRRDDRVPAPSDHVPRAADTGARVKVHLP